MLDTRAGLIRVALGKIAAELIIKNTRLVNVYSGEIQNGIQVAVWRGRIAYVGPSSPQPGPDTEVVDAQGMYLSPGFFDIHGHPDLINNPLALASQILPTGTTGMLADTHEICGGLGAKGLEIMLKATEDIPFRYYLAAPAACPPTPDFEGEEIFTAETIRSFLSHSRVKAISEVTAWARLLEPDLEFLEKLVVAQEQGRRIEGHMSGCSYDKLNALTDCGFTSCHESITAEDALQRLRLGVHVVLRHGSIRADLEPLSRLITENPGLDTNRIMLTPDWLSPQDVMKYGYMNYLVARAVELGIPPMKAIQMVSINPAVYLGVEQDIGGIAPGRLADMLLLESIERPLPLKVYIGGKLIAQDGKLLVKMPEFPEVPVSQWREGRLPKLATAADFVVKSEAQRTVNLPCIHMVNKTITKLVQLELPVAGGEVWITGHPDLLKLSRWSGTAQGWVTAVLSGFGSRVGGVASSMGHDSHHPIAMGNNAEDIAVAVNRMVEIGGGMVIAEHGEVILESPWSAGGISSRKSIAEVAEELTAINRYLQQAGCPWDDPMFALGFLSFTGLPYVRITPKGILDVRTKQIVYP